MNIHSVQHHRHRHQRVKLASTVMMAGMEKEVRRVSLAVLVHFLIRRAPLRVSFAVPAHTLIRRAPPLGRRVCRAVPAHTLLPALWFALATLALQALTAESAPSAWRGHTCYTKVLLLAPTVQQVNFQGRSVPHPMCVKDAPQTPTHLRRATRRSTALATRAQQALTAETVHSAWQGHTSCTKELLVVCFAPRANILRSRVQFRKTPARIVH